MAYTPTVWATGDVITAEKLNKAEQGIADAGAYIVPITVTEEGVPTGLEVSYNDIAENASRGIYGLMDMGENGQFYCPFLGFGAHESVYIAQFASYNYTLNAYEAVAFRSTDPDENMVKQV